jgi:pyridinium-3,5-biscarboxylic acid mononucleotide synthase
LLQDVQAGTLDIDAALGRLRDLPYSDIGYAKLDNHRALRTGFPEVVYCQGKSPEQAAGAVAALAERHGRVLATRADSGHARAILDQVPGAVYHAEARAVVAASEPVTPRWSGLVAVITAGTADLPVAEEAALTAEVVGCRVARANDVGVAGLHRLLHQLPLLQEAAVIIAVAGMEGALPGVAAALTDRPVIAVPTSTGYGANFGGLAALLTMLNTCAPGVTVTNIDNGFGAAMTAARIVRLMEGGPNHQHAEP